MKKIDDVNYNNKKGRMPIPEQDKQIGVTVYFHPDRIAQLDDTLKKKGFKKRSLYLKYCYEFVDIIDNLK